MKILKAFIIASSLLIHFSLFALAPLSALLPVSMVASTSIDQSLPLNAINGKGWSPEANLEFVKLHLYFDKEFSLSKIEIDSCKGAFTSPANMFVNFFDRVVLENKGSQLISNGPHSGVRSITINFTTNKNICVSQVKLFDPKGVPYILVPPKVVDGKVSASSTLNPHSSYNVMNLFDGKYEYAWSADGKSVGENLNFEFAQPQHIEKIKLWNGYQRSDVHCYSNARIKKLLLEGDNNYRSELNIADIMGAQEIVLEKPYTGKTLKLTIEEAYPGKKYKDLVVSELRFNDGKDWFYVNPLESLKNIINQNRQEFQKADLRAVLDETLFMNEFKGSKSKNWMFRFRSDGSAYIEGFVENAGRFENFYALGSYEVKESSPQGIQLRVFGFLRKNEDEGGDCNGCGRDCNQSKSEEYTQEKIFEDYVTLSKTGTEYTIQNTSAAKKLNFTQLKLKLKKPGQNE